MTTSPIIIATAQSLISQDVRNNGAEIRRLMTQARGQGARLINFPEAALSGYVAAQIHDWQEVNWDVLREEIALTQQLAADLGLWVALGCNHQLTAPHKPHNAVYIISDQGELHDRYDKQWCSHNETLNWYTPGHGLCLFEVDGWRFGCAICIEIQFPELFMAYAAEQVDCLLYAVYKDSAMFGIQAQAYAATNTYWFSLANASQESETLVSQMIGPNGEVQAQCTPHTSSLCITLLDITRPDFDIALTKAKPWRLAARQPDYYQSRMVSDARSSNKQVL